MANKLVPAVLATALLLSLLPAPVSAATGSAPVLTDIAGHWAEADIRAAAAAGWVNGYPGADTADRGGKYRSLLIGDTLINNPVLRLTYDGKSVTAVSRPATLRSYLDNLNLTYEMEPAGEGGAAPHVDPPETEAHTIMETFIMTLGHVPGR